MGIALYILAVQIATFLSALLWRPAGAALVLILATILAVAAPLSISVRALCLRASLLARFSGALL